MSETEEKVEKKLKARYGRALLKISGEVLGGGEGEGLDPVALGRVAGELGRIVKGSDAELAVVVGGGNIMRGRDAKEIRCRVRADYMGMLGTVINALALQDALEQVGVPARALTSIPMSPVAEPYRRDVALRHLEEGNVVIFGAGTGHPFFSTDTTAALRAAEIGAACLVKGTNVDAIYDADPKEHRDAEKLSRLTYDEALRRDVGIMDAAAFSLCRQSDIPILVVDIRKDGNIERAIVRGEGIGTIVEG
ncbi:MAG: UMP kinase [Synergistaceae bacterium]|nr:UMP kinase [Synergistaceae bacterium]